MAVLFRSEKVSKCQLFLQTDAAYACVAELGELGLVQFNDLNPDVSAFQRKFVNEIRRCDEMERRLRYFEKEIKKDQIAMPDHGINPDAPQPREMADLEATLEQLEQELREINSNQEMLNKNFLELSELRHVLTKTQAFFDEKEDIHAAQTLHERTGSVGYINPVMESDVDTDVASFGRSSGQLTERNTSEIGFLAGVISREKEAVFERLLWRACRGNVFMRKEEIDEFLYDPTTVMNQTRELRAQDLSKMAIQIRAWFTKVRKMKAIYHTLNLFNLDVTRKCLIAECWCPDNDLEKIQLALKRGTDESGSLVPSIINKIETREIPPTYHRTNKFTQGFQNIVDAYGVASYREANPALFTIISFPFLFAVMFGDFGHGMIMFLAALAFIIFERKLQSMRIKDEIFNTFFSGRYIILLMGAFSMYTGLVYNEFYSKGINVYGSSWKVDITRGAAYKHLYATEETATQGEPITMDPKIAYSGNSYPFGIDPVKTCTQQV